MTNKDKDGRGKIISLLEERKKKNIPSELHLTYTIIEEIDRIYEKLELQDKIILDTVKLLQNLLDATLATKKK